MASQDEHELLLVKAERKNLYVFYYENPMKIERKNDCRHKF